MISRREDEGKKMKMQLQKQVITHTVGQPIEFVERSTHRKKQENLYIPVSAIDIEGLLGRELAISTLFCWKNVVVQDAALSMETLANHGWTFAI